MASVNKLVADVLQHIFWMIMDQLILKPEHGDAVRFEKGLASRIVLRAQYIVMNGTVYFNRKFLTRAVEVYNVRPDAVLAPELASAQLSFLQRIPQPGLRRCHVAAQALAMLL